MMGINLYNMVPEVGLEPTWYCYQWILSPSRLPISPPGHALILSLKPVILASTFYLFSFQTFISL